MREPPSDGGKPAREQEPASNGLETNGLEAQRVGYVLGSLQPTHDLQSSCQSRESSGGMFPWLAEPMSSRAFDGYAVGVLRATAEIVRSGTVPNATLPRYNSGSLEGR